MAQPAIINVGQKLCINMFRKPGQASQCQQYKALAIAIWLNGSFGMSVTAMRAAWLLLILVLCLVVLEWTQLSQNLPTYGGAVYTRWGRTSCSAKSSLVYKGEMAGPDHLSSGGGSNYQCMPEDPRYGHMATAVYSSLRAVKFWLGHNISSGKTYTPTGPLVQFARQSSELHNS